jgi:hypothetical protein
MTLPNINLAKQLVDRLNEFVKLDPIGLSRLVNIRVVTTEAVADHEDIQVVMEGGTPYVGFLGVLNGICGGDDRGGSIIAEFDDMEVLTRFMVRE